MAEVEITFGDKDYIWVDIDSTEFNDYIQELTSDNNNLFQKTFCSQCWCEIPVSKRKKHSFHSMHILIGMRFSSKEFYLRTAKQSDKCKNGKVALLKTAFEMWPEVEEDYKTANTMFPELEKELAHEIDCRDRDQQQLLDNAEKKIDEKRVKLKAQNNLLVNTMSQTINLKKDPQSLHSMGQNTMIKQ